MGSCAVSIACITKYDTEAGIGTLIATIIPYTITFIIIWTILFIGWFAFEIPVGPGAAMFIGQ
jgi:aminobenzoyl-glutamate transport protein